MLTHPKSLERLKLVHPDLARVIMAAYDRAVKAGLPYTVAQGLRTYREQELLYAQGRTLPGRKVTWTMESRHLTGHAVDLAIIIGGKYMIDDELYDELAVIINETAQDLGIPLIWGGTFKNAEGKPRPDRPHYELDKRVYK